MCVVASELILPGGMATTKKSFFNNQQWDFPNAWAPLQQMVIEGLDIANTRESESLDVPLLVPYTERGLRVCCSGTLLALALASRWVETNFLAFQK